MLAQQHTPLVWPSAVVSILPVDHGRGRRAPAVMLESEKGFHASSAYFPSPASSELAIMTSRTWPAFRQHVYTSQIFIGEVAKQGWILARTFFIILKAKGEATLSMKLTRKAGTKGTRGSRCARTVPFVRGLPSTQTGGNIRTQLFKRLPQSISLHFFAIAQRCTKLGSIGVAVRCMALS